MITGTSASNESFQRESVQSHYFGIVSCYNYAGVFQVATLDQFKDIYQQYLGLKKNSVPNVACAAMTSGLIYSVATMPLEASKNRMASQKKDPVTGKLPYRGILQTLTKVAADEGFLALYNGFFPYYLRCGGHTVSMFVLVEIIRGMYRDKFM